LIGFDFKAFFFCSRKLDQSINGAHIARRSFKTSRNKVESPEGLSS